MEVFTGDRPLPNPDDFPLHVAPFPEPTDLLYAHPTAMIDSSSGTTHRPISPAQKLRPIRSSVRSPVSDFTENEGLVETLEKGFLSDEAAAAAVCAVDGELDYCAVKVGTSWPPRSSPGCDNGDASVAVVAGDPAQFGSGSADAVEGGDPNGAEQVLEDGSR